MSGPGGEAAGGRWPRRPAFYTMLIALAALLAKGRATGKTGLLRVLTAGGIMLAPGPGFGAASLLSSPDHTAPRSRCCSPGSRLTG